MTGPARDEQTESSRLSELLACEEELQLLRERARDEAAELVARARREATDREAALDAELTGELERLRGRIEEEARREIERARAQAETQAARYDAVGDAEVERLADVAFLQLLGRSHP
jgi:F0F1-type ATP synthase membrane subunit b/b'